MNASSLTAAAGDYKSGNLEELLHIGVCADLLGVSDYELRGLVERDQIDAVRIDNRTYIQLRELVRFARARNAAEREQWEWASAIARDIEEKRIDTDGVIAAMAERVARMESVR